MKFVSFLLVPVVAIALSLNLIPVSDAQQTLPRCSSTYTRPEIRALSSTQWQSISGVLRRMNTDGWFAWFAYLHQNNFSTIHGNSMFFPFHRRFVQDFESVGRRYSSSFVVPYWDSARDYAAPHTSQVLTPSLLGGNGQGSARCVANGLEFGWTLTYPQNHCLRRIFNGQQSNTIRPWYSPEYMLSLLQRDTTMTNFRPDMEFTLHGAVHLGIGGDMATMPSPNDFLFMMHHANIDRLWWVWQTQYNHMWTLDGPAPNGQAISLNTNIIAYNEPIRTVMQLGYGNMCFMYSGTTAPAAAAASAPTASSLNRVTAASLTSGPSGGASSSEGQVQSSVQSLPSGVLNQFFPNTNSQLSGTRSNSLTRRTPQGTGNLPKPFPLTDAWINMHHYDPADFRRRYQVALNFVSTLNNVGYKSPFIQS